VQEDLTFLICEFCQGLRSLTFIHGKSFVPQNLLSGKWGRTDAVSRGNVGNGDQVKL
jgi:hypothetical protein